MKAESRTAKTKPYFNKIGSHSDFLKRKVRDSNPRIREDLRLSKPLQSTSLPTFRCKGTPNFDSDNFFLLFFARKQHSDFVSEVFVYLGFVSCVFEYGFGFFS